MHAAWRIGKQRKRLFTMRAVSEETSKKQCDRHARGTTLATALATALARFAVCSGEGSWRVRSEKELLRQKKGAMSRQVGRVRGSLQQSGAALT